MTESKKDKLYRSGIARIKPFEFNGQVADVFPDMIKRSVPGYSMLLSMIGILAEQYVKPDSHVYDLGCSLGAMTLAIRPHLHNRHCRIIAVDNSSAMIERCRNIMDRDHSSTKIDVLCEDIRQVSIHNASFVMLNYTMQFIPVEERRLLLDSIFTGMNPGGVLVLSEKIIEENKEDGQTLTDLHEQFKKQNGYNDLEISQKRSALENVLIPETINTHCTRLYETGFTEVVVWLKCLNFVSLLAIKVE